MTQEASGSPKVWPVFVTFAVACALIIAASALVIMVVGPGEGNIVQDSRGNMWVIHNSVQQPVRADATGGTLHGKPPIAGPDA